MTLLMARVECRFTFLDVLLDEEERVQDMRRNRARSEPPRACADMANEDDTAEPESTPLVDQTSRDAPRCEPAAEPASHAAIGCNNGSIGHPILCKRPCVHVAKGGPCPLGDPCPYCHFPHRVLHRPKEEQRAFMKKMPTAELLSTILGLLQEKAQATKLQGTEPLFDLLRAEIHKQERPKPTACGHDPAKKRLLRGLRQTMQKMNFAGLASMAVSKCQGACQTELVQAIERLRM